VGTADKPSLLFPHLLCRALVVFVAVVMDGAFAASVAGFLIMHAQLLSVNCTTIEVSNLVPSLLRVVRPGLCM
jgi:hypothetical protein